MMPTSPMPFKIRIPYLRHPSPCLLITGDGLLFSLCAALIGVTSRTDNRIDRTFAILIKILIPHLRHPAPCFVMIEDLVSR